MMECSIKQMAKNAVRNTWAYQYYRSRKSFSAFQPRYEKLFSDEKSERQRVCVLKNDKTEQLVRMTQMISITIRSNQRFQHWIDTGLHVYTRGGMIDNIPPNYELIIKYSIEELKQLMKRESNRVSENNLRLLQAVSIYIDRVIEEIDLLSDFAQEKDFNLERTRNYFIRMKSQKAESLEEVLQRILFWDSLFWQSGHRLVGLGRLDKILDGIPLPQEEQTIQIIRDFYQELHRYYAYKSNPISLGDTGQIIILGGVEPDGSYFANQYTWLFLKAFLTQPIPDPKALLRVSAKMPQDLLQLALRCIATGMGSPLLSNDDVVIPAIEAFGYTHSDACNYVTSACWEPLVYGKSLEQNNINDINFAEALVRLYQDDKFADLSSFEEVKELYLLKLREEVQRKLKMLDEIVWEENPLMSLFTENCLCSGKDIAFGGAVYNNYGLLTAGLANSVNSLLNIKTCVLGKLAQYSLQEIKAAATSDYQQLPEMKKLLSQKGYYGLDEDETILLVNEITGYVQALCRDYRNMFGGKVKWGLSSSNYAEVGKMTATTLDGREAYKPLATHISAPQGAAYTELLRFAGRMNYKGQRSNGNVVDLIVSPEFINNNMDKFLLFIQVSMQVGFYQMQMNVVSSRMLIAAKENPQDFPNLIVRVWGFSAYFAEIPEMYQDVLIQRALESEQVI